jgi:long-subunit acyl-CoA synthetase (AMP-forming)
VHTHRGFLSNVYGVTRFSALGESDCMLSVLPLYCVEAFEEFDCGLLKNNVLEAYSNKTWRFASHYSRKYAGWAMRFA